MNPGPITLPDLNSPPHKDLVEHLAVRWAVAELPASISYLYIDYLLAIGALLVHTQSPEQTQVIFMSTLNQAVDLGKSSPWLEDELCFEAAAYTAEPDRETFLRLDLEEALAIDASKLDICLDRYNERLSRFNPTPMSHDQ